MTEPTVPPQSQLPPWIKYVLIGCGGLALLAIVFIVIVIVIAIVSAISIPNLKEAQDRARIAETGGEVHRGTLGPGDMTGALEDNWYDEYPLGGGIGDRFVITLYSTDFDAYLQVIAPNGGITHDDDSAGGTDARVEVTLDETGTWRVWAKALGAGASGDYMLTIERSP
jgi:hypothetical protein